MSSDVTSFYPNLAIRNGWAPAHLPAKEFCELYEWFFEERKKIPKKDPKNYVYKIILNSTFGLSIDENSFLYDPQFGMQITINGQLTLMMLYEMLAEGIPDSIPLMQNTDGLEMMIPERYKDKYLAICTEWEQITNLQLEHDEYSRLILADVNNYIAVNTAGKYKCKGRFEFEDLALHKNKSFLIIPKALFNYFVKDIPPERSLMENKNILDYCAGVKIKGNWEFQQTCIKKGIITTETLQKTIRYYISEKGCKIMKINKSDKREIQLESGKWLQVDLSKLHQKPWLHYFVDEKYYLDKIYKEIHNICPVKSNQTSLF
jgi:DNA polymerase